MPAANKLIAELGASRTLIENFPMSVLDDLGPGLVTYNNAFDFIIDLLSLCAKTKTGNGESHDWITRLISEFYETEYNFELNIEENIFSATTVKNKKINFIENTVKILLNSFFGGLFSCSLSPFIPGRFFDSSSFHDGQSCLMDSLLKENIDKRVFDTAELSIPIKCLDLFNILKISPTSFDGLKYYDAGASYEYYKKIHNENTDTYEYISEDDLKDYDETLSYKEKRNAKLVSDVSEYPNKLSPIVVCKYTGILPSMLYLTNDMNAFIWYVMNLSYSNDPVSYNKMMWDNRNNVTEKYSIFNTKTFKNNFYEYWYNSKVIDTTYPTDLQIQNYWEVNYPDGEFGVNPELNTAITSMVKPIIQLEPQKGIYDGVDKGNGITFHIPSQVYYKPEKKEHIHSNSAFPNATMSKWNRDYLDSIQIFNPRFLLVRTLEYLSGGMIGLFQNMPTINEIIIQNKIRQVIKNYCQSEDKKIEDCYFEFSNEDFDEAIKEVENERRLRYAKIYTNSGDKSNFNPEDLTKALNNGTKQDIQNTVYRSVVDEKNSDNNEGDKTTPTEIKYGIKSNLLNSITREDLIMAFIMPFVESMFTPQIMLYIFVNLKAVGLIDEDSLKDVNNAIDSPVVRFIVVRMLSIVKSIIKFVTDYILEHLLMWAFEMLSETIYQRIGLENLEKIQYWIELLTEAYKALPLIAGLPKSVLLKRSTKDGPDDVYYADITDTGNDGQDKPASNNKC